MNRTATREQAFKLIYSLEIQKQQEKLEEAIELYEESNQITDKNAKIYIADAILGIQKNKKEILHQIEKNLKLLLILSPGAVIISYCMKIESLYRNRRFWRRCNQCRTLNLRRKESC